MMHKGRAVFFGLISLILLILFTVLLGWYSYVKTESLLFLWHLISYPIFYIPFGVYILLGIVLTSSLSTALMYFMARQPYNNLSTKVNLLANNQFESPLLQNTKWDNDVIVQQTQVDILAIKNKLIKLSKELQLLNNQPQLVDGETKEAILEGERHRLARELHDSVSQQLFAAMMLLSALNEENQTNLTASQQKMLSTIESIISEAQSEMRALLLHLRPVNLEGKSLRDGIAQLLKELQTKIQIKMVWDMDDLHAEKGVEDHLFRIVQEILSNTLRHAKATEMDVFLKEVDNNILLKVVDDGVGFDLKKQAENVGSYGLKNIQERVNSLGGLLKIISFPNQGTSVEVKIPMLKEK